MFRAMAWLITVSSIAKLSLLILYPGRHLSSAYKHTTLTKVISSELELLILICSNFLILAKCYKLGKLSFLATI